MSIASDLIRQANIGMVCNAADDLIIPSNVTCRKNLQYGKDSVWNVFDIYYETSCKKKHPTLINIHGGGWVSNTKESYEKYCLDLAARGFNVINFTFRLAPENKHPAMISDINQMISHLCKHSCEYELDMENVFMVGDSAGGHMLSMYAAICTNPDYARTFSFKTPKEFVPKAIALNCGVYDIYLGIEADAAGLTRQTIYDYLGDEPNHFILEQNNTISQITSDYPPVYLMTANEDVFQDQYEIMLKVLNKNGIKNIHRKYGDETTKLGHVFHLDVESVFGKQCNGDECKFFLDIYNKKL